MKTSKMFGLLVLVCWILVGCGPEPDLGSCLCGDLTCGADVNESADVEICVPDCKDKKVGDYDGCNGTCECIPTCENRECGDDGCGSSCGDCEAGDCYDGVCMEFKKCDDVCVPSCEEGQCGHDGCGGTCGDCWWDYHYYSGLPLCIKGECVYQECDEEKHKETFGNFDEYCFHYCEEPKPEELTSGCWRWWFDGTGKECSGKACIGIEGVAAEIYEVTTSEGMGGDVVSINTLCGTPMLEPEHKNVFWAWGGVADYLYDIYLTVDVKKIYGKPGIFRSGEAEVSFQYFQKFESPVLDYSETCSTYSYRAYQEFVFQEMEGWTPLGEACLTFQSEGVYIIRLQYPWGVLL